MDALVPIVKAVIIMDGEGHRLSAKVCLFPPKINSAELIILLTQYYAKSEFPTHADRVCATYLFARNLRHDNVNLYESI